MSKKKLILFSLLLIALVIGFVYFKHLSSENPDEITLFGNVDIRKTNLSFRVFGKIQELFVDEGDLVVPGTLLAKLDPEPYIEDLKQAENSLASIQAEADNAEKVFARRQELIGNRSVSQEDYQRSLYSKESIVSRLKSAEAAKQLATISLADTRLFCPTRGTILTRVQEKGAVVERGQTVFVLSVESPVWVRAYIGEPNLGSIFPGMKAQIFTDAKGGRVYRGHIGFISPVAEFTPKTVETTTLRQDLVFRLRVMIEDPDEGLRQGMPVTVKLGLK